MIILKENDLKVGNISGFFDMHIHSKNSHDSECDIFDMAKAAKQKGAAGFAVTDHCDVGFYKELNLKEIVGGSFFDAKKADDETDLTILKGIEIGETILNKSVADEIINSFDFDVVIGSVHTVRLKNFEMPYSQIDFSKMEKDVLEAFLNQYFDDMLEMAETFDFDILAHLTCPFRYINGKYMLGESCEKFDDKITKILNCIIKRKIALEINTSCLYSGSKYPDFMPEKQIICKYKKMGGELITIGSDAHISENFANSFDKAFEFIKSIGFENVYYYKNRCAKKCAL